MTMVTTTAAPTKSITWRDFSFEEHVRAYIGVPSNCILRIRKVHSNTYRLNVIQTTGEILKSAMVKVIETPDGYVFREYE
jgi:hypothetical protein